MTNSIDKFAFTNGFELLSDAELQNAIGGWNLFSVIGRGINDFCQGFADGYSSY